LATIAPASDIEMQPVPPAWVYIYILV
jgi:hypothetical protein